MSDIGLLGGTFDPFHSGHLEIALSALNKELIKKVIIMPARVSPFKQGREMAPGEDRFNMVSLIADDYEGIEVSRLELDNDDVSYTFKTLTLLREKDPENTYHLIIGSDQFLALESWYKGIDILKNFPLILAPRPGYEEKEHMEMMEKYREVYGTSIDVLQNKLLDISSTDIKQRIREGKSVSGLLPEEIEKYIYEHGLYR